MLSYVASNSSATIPPGRPGLFGMAGKPLDQSPVPRGENFVKAFLGLDASACFWRRTCPQCTDTTLRWADKTEVSVMQPLSTGFCRSHHACFSSPACHLMRPW